MLAGAAASGIAVTVFGPARPDSPVPIVDAAGAIGNEEEPAMAVRSRQDASIVKAARAVGAGEADALVSAGPTGATLAAAVLHVKRIRGVHRPAGAAGLPLSRGPAPPPLPPGAHAQGRPQDPSPVAHTRAAL